MSIDSNVNISKTVEDIKPRHPTLAKGETFLGNTKRVNDCLQEVAGLRLASPAYDIYGNPLDESECYFALIATTPAAADAYNRLMEARLSAIRRGSVRSAR